MLAIEEQALFQQHRRPYYPVRIGEVFQNRYHVVTKLGYGAYSTVWLAKDQSFNNYACLKVCVRDDGTDASPVLNEINMLHRLADKASGSDHPGRLFTRLAREIFQIEGPAGQHHCIVLDPQANSLRALQELVPDSRLPKLLVRSAMHRILFALNWLHLECGVIHTDVSPTNVLMDATDSGIFEQAEKREEEDPSLPVAEDVTPIYNTRPTHVVMSGTPWLTDYGQMRLYEPNMTGWCMPDLYRAPEVLLKLPWHHSVDVWSVAVMTLELLEGRNLFDPIDWTHRQYVLPLALAQYIGYLGPPPLDLIQKSPLFSEYFDEAGNWIGGAPIPTTSLEDFVTVLAAGEEKDLFLRFIRKLLTWNPDVRQTSGEILRDEWLMRPTELM